MSGFAGLGIPPHLQGRHTRAQRGSGSSSFPLTTVLAGCAAVGASVIGILLLTGKKQQESSSSSESTGFNIDIAYGEAPLPTQQQQQQEEKELTTAAASGLRNIGNTCFFNSVLQSFAASSRFLRYLHNLHQRMPEDQFILQFLLCLQGKMPRNDPTPFHRALTAEATQFRGGMQQDSHELYNCCLELLGRRLKKMNKSALSDPCHGLSGSVLMCKVCGNGRPINHSVFTALTLPLGSRAVTLQDCIASYCQVELVHGVNCALCSCRKTEQVVAAEVKALSAKTARRSKRGRLKQAAQLQAVQAQQESLKKEHQRLVFNGSAFRIDPALWEATSPRVTAHASTQKTQQQQQRRSFLSTGTDPLLILNQQKKPSPSGAMETPAVAPVRVQTDTYKFLALGRIPNLLVFHLNRLMGDMKLDTYVRFPLKLDMSPFHSMDVYRCDTQVDNGRQEQKSVPDWYNLVAVVVHYGSRGGGHFTCFRQSTGAQGNPTWVHISDSSVKEVPVQTVLSASAYMLFYEKASLKQQQQQQQSQ